MRQVIHILIVANILYFGWQRFADAPGREVGNVMPAEVRRLLTLEEAGTQQKPIEVKEIESAMAVEPPGAGVTFVCHTLGPFLESSRMKAIETQLNELGLEPKRRAEEIQEHVGYWVYLPAKDRIQAMLLTDHLDQNNDKEYFIGRDYVISLGAFKEEYRAQRRMKSARKLGLEPLLAPRYRTRTVHWLDIVGVDDEASLLGAIQIEDPEVRLQDSACP